MRNRKPCRAHTRPNGPIKAAILCLAATVAPNVRHLEAQQVLRSTTRATAQIPQAELRLRPLRDSDSTVLTNLRKRMSAQDFSQLAREWTVTHPHEVKFGDTLIPFPDTASMALDTGMVRGTGGRDAVFAIPESYIFAGTSGSTHSLDLILRARSMRFDHASREFVGQVDIWTQDPLDPSGEGSLTDSIAVQILGDVETITPDQASIGHLGIPTTRISIHDPEALDSVAVLVVTRKKPEGYSLRIPVRPALEVRAGADTIEGWGIEATDITVSVRGGGSVPDTHVEVLAQPGSPSPGSVTVSSGHAARLTLRSGRLGPASVEASATPLETGTTSVYYSFPSRFILAAAFGALVGVLLSGRRKKSAEKGPGYFSMAFHGLLAGVVVVLAYLVVGVNLLPIDLPAQPVYNEALVFIVSVLGTFAWSRGVLAIQKWRER